MPKIIAIEKPVTDAETGAVATYHVVAHYGCMLAHDTCSVVFAGYVSREAHEAKKKPIMHSAAQLKQRPTGDCAAWPEWFCQRLLESTVPGDALAGATPVFAAEDGEVQA
jgi:hypothetical protein